MGTYKIFFRKSVRKDFEQIPKKDLKRILKRIESLADNPRPKGCEKLSGQEKYRIRQGTYRILYTIEDDTLIICVVRVGHGKEVYRH